MLKFKNFLGLCGLVSSVSVMAEPGGPAWTSAQSERTTIAAATCTGGEFTTRARDASEIIQSLPKSGERPSELSDERARDIYNVAGGLLKPSIANPERAFDAPSLLKCRPDPSLGVELMTFLAADGPSNFRGPSNVFYWLGQAYRRGIGVAPDAKRAQFLFLTARALGMGILTVEDWGARPTDTLMAVLAQPANRRMLEEAASAGRSEAQFLLGDLLLSSDKSQARSLLRAAIANGSFRAARRLADLEMQGAFGAPDFVEAARLRATIARSDNEDFVAMLAAARAFNGGDIPSSERTVSLADIGGASLLVSMAKAEVDHVRGRIPLRGLLAPDGRIIFTEVSSPPMRQFRIAAETLKAFAPAKLKSLPPYMTNGRAVFAWVDLPPINWR